MKPGKMTKLAIVKPATNDPKTATKLEEIDLLRLKVASMNLETATREKDAVLVAILVKYTGNPAGKIGIGPDGTIVRPDLTI